MQKALSGKKTPYD